MAIVPLMIDNSGCQCNSVITLNCSGVAICQDLCTLVANCPNVFQLRFFGDLLDTPPVCVPNQILGTDASCAGVVFVNPCTLLNGCGFTDDKVAASSTDLGPGFLSTKLRTCPGGALQITKKNPSTINEFLEICFSPVSGTLRLIDTGDGPGAYAACTVNGFPRPGNIQMDAGFSGWQIKCPVQRAIGKLRFDISTETEVNPNVDGFFVPNGTWTLTTTTPTSIVTTSDITTINAPTLFSNVVGTPVGTRAALVVPRTGWYTVGMRGAMKFSHGIHTIRPQLWRIKAFAFSEFLLDDRFEGPEFKDASHEDAFYGDNANDGTAFRGNLAAVYFDGNLVRGMSGFGFGQSKPVYLDAGDMIVLVHKFNTGVVGETYLNRPRIGTVGLNDNNMTGGTGPGTEIRLMEEQELYYPI